MDYMSAIKVAMHNSRTNLHNKTDIRLHHGGQHVCTASINLQHVSSKDIQVEFLTKAIDPPPPLIFARRQLIWNISGLTLAWPHTSKSVMPVHQES